MQVINEKAFVDFAKNVDIASQANGEKSKCIVPFSEHFTQFAAVGLSWEKHFANKFSLSVGQYYGLGQYIIENSDLYEKTMSPDNFEPSRESDVNWDFVCDVHDALNARLKKIDFPFDLKKEAISFTINAVENWLIYQQLHPNTAHNPWQQPKKILEDGFLFLLSNSKDIGDKKFRQEYENERNLLSSPDLALWSVNRKKVTVRPLTSVEKMQNAALDYLAEQRKNFGSKGKHVKASKLREAIVQAMNGGASNKLPSGLDNEIQKSVIFPLKRLGLIGSSTKGYFYIANAADFQEAYDYMESLRDGIEKTMRAYAARAQQQGIALRP